ALAPALAEARAGGGTSAGSRGTRTYQSAQATPTAPQSAPVERSTTTQRQATQPTAQPAAPAAQPSFFQRNPFLAGMMGGLLGVGLGGLLFGSGLFGEGLAGFSGFLGLLLQGALIAGLVWLAISFFRRRAGAGATQRSDYAFAGATPDADHGAERRPIVDVAPIDLATGKTGAAPSAAPSSHGPQGRDAIGVTETDYAEFERLLIDIQSAWSKGDLGALRRHVTPEILSYFSEQLSANASAGIENRVEDVKFEAGDLAEAWSEDDLDYATVAMRWTARDYKVRADNGMAVEGGVAERIEAREVWTFLRAASGPQGSGRWLLSAIQQV
ncbi:MAG: TIM44-like domain-containing protein, partial [Proteobacteria bacterium]|nr:TIM44-like domain-containing protein [Pseudomonadota bacterium]